MYHLNVPKPVPREPGCVSLRVHKGVCSVSGSNVIGTSDPDVFVHVIWKGGVAYVATLWCDVSNQRPELQNLLYHQRTYPERWEKLNTPNA